VVHDTASSLLWLSHNRDVRVLRWPADAAEEPDSDQAPCLWLVEPGATPPNACGCLEDWVWLGASDMEIQARLSALATRAANHPGRASVNEFGQLSYRGRSLFLSPTDQRIIEALVEHFGEVVEDDDLLASTWPDGGNTQVLRVHISRLRRRVRPLGLGITSVRGTGYLITELDNRSRPDPHEH
jgi:hypothetical protein